MSSSNSRNKSERDYRRTVVADLEEFLGAKPDAYPQSVDHMVAKLDSVWDEHREEIEEMGIAELAGHLINATGYYNGIAHPFVRR